MVFSCCTQDINLRIEVDDSAVYSPDSSAVYFVAHASAWKKGKPTWFIMPIEGKTKYLYNNVSLYLYRIQEQSISPILDLGTIPYALSGWKIRLVPSELGVSMTIAPLQGWDSGSSRHGIAELRKKLERVFIIDIDGKLSYSNSHFPDEKLKKADLAYINSIVKNLPYAEFGLHFNGINPSNDK